ncbi:hypothetical protein HKX48_002393 [Thoreauomyces humboldtii]|nr:hypothetical protein HKX48_002393 [Thoreauomyces humboldtii]
MSFRPSIISRVRRPLGFALAAGLGAYSLDRYFYDSTLQRNVRTLACGAIVTADYKWNFVPGNAKNLEALHERVAERILNVCRDNGGLYVKFGQQIAAIPVLPPAYHRRFRVLVWQADYVQDHIRLETDFMNEARNAETAAKHISEAPRSLAARVHVPDVYWAFTSTRVMTAEWIEGVRMTSPERLADNGWSKKEVMRTIVDVFADQIFRTGFIHSDPHQGNIIVRSHPKDPKKPQVVLLDHGLYVTATPTFKHDYAVFWKSLFSGDMTTLNRIAQSWGIADVQMFASATLQKPWAPQRPPHVDPTGSSAIDELFEKQVRMKQSVKTFLESSGRFPKELIFVGRNMNLVRANNKALGSPVNRVNIMANYAVQTLGDDWSLWGNVDSSRELAVSTMPLSKAQQITATVQARINYWTFRATLFVTAIFFHMARAAQKIRYLVNGVAGPGFEDLVDSGMKKTMEEQFGVVIDDAAFSG